MSFDDATKRMPSSWIGPPVTLSDSEGETLSQSVARTLIERTGSIGELALDLINDEGVFCCMPVVSKAVSIYKLGNSIRDRHFINKLAAFFDEFGEDSSNAGRHEEYARRFATKDCDRELEYVMILVDRCLDSDKTKQLARLYESFLNGHVSWDEFQLLAGAVDRFLPGDYDVLAARPSYTTFKGVGTEAMLRLVGLGLMIEEVRVFDLNQTHDGKGNLSLGLTGSESAVNEERRFKRTGLGDKLVSAICNPHRVLT